MKNRKLLHTSTLDAKNTHVGAINTGSILFREYLRNKKNKVKCRKHTLGKSQDNSMASTWFIYTKVHQN